MGQGITPFAVILQVKYIYQPFPEDAIIGQELGDD